MKIYDCDFGNCRLKAKCIGARGISCTRYHLVGIKKDPMQRKKVRVKRTGWRSQHP